MSRFSDRVDYCGITARRAWEISRNRLKIPYNSARELSNWTALVTSLSLSMVCIAAKAARAFRLRQRSVRAGISAIGRSKLSRRGASQRHRNHHRLPPGSMKTTGTYRLSQYRIGSSRIDFLYQGCLHVRSIHSRSGASGRPNGIAPTRLIIPTPRVKHGYDKYGSSLRSVG